MTKCHRGKVDIASGMHDTNAVLIEFGASNTKRIECQNVETFAGAANIGVIFNQIVRHYHNG